MQLTLDLVDSKGLYSSLADDICSSTAMFEQDPRSTSCWNGTDVDMYAHLFLCLYTFVFLFVNSDTGLYLLRLFNIAHKEVAGLSKTITY